MKAIFYYVMRAYTSLGLVFYYKNILVSGKKNIAKNKAIVFISNHPNALIDPLLVSYSDLRPIHYLTQAAAFSGSFVNIILEALNMIPVYRVRDGIGKEKLISLNEQTFRHCHDILNNRGIILIYVEGSHNVRRKVRPFRKGFARIVFGAMDKYNDLEIDIIPVGMNYTEVDAYASKVSINYGKPIAVRPFWKNKDRNEAINKIKAEAESKLKLVTVDISNTENYDKIIKYFEPEEFLYPEKVNEKLKFINLNSPTHITNKPKNKFRLLEFLVKINSIFPLLIWKKIKPTIKQTEYLSTYRFMVGLTAFPIFYFLQAWLVSYFFGNSIGIIYLISSFLSIYVLTKTK